MVDKPGDHTSRSSSCCWFLSEHDFLTHALFGALQLISGMIDAALKQLYAGHLHSLAACDACDKAVGPYVLINKGSKVSVQNAYNTKT